MAVKMIGVVKKGDLRTRPTKKSLAARVAVLEKLVANLVKKAK